MSLFPEYKLDNKKYIILNASRMTDMPKFYPLDIIKEVTTRIEKGLNIHTLVLWTKHPDSLLKEPLFTFLNSLKKQNIQLYIQLTITGMGSKVIGNRKDSKDLIIEPNVPDYITSINCIPEIIKLVENPLRIRLRIDPIIRIVDYFNTNYTNIKYFEDIVEKVSKLSVTNFTFSFLENNAHKKVNKRFEELGCKIIAPTDIERENTKKWLLKIQEKYNVSISSCCIPGFSITKCIDGELLQSLHDLKLPTDLSQPKKRELCGCTNSIDLGGWPPKKCFSGCDYCYANSSYSII